MSARVALPFLLALNALGAATPAAAQPATFKAGDGTVDLAVPESPAFAALGVTPQEITRPTSARELAMSLLNGVDRDGNFQTGVAIDTAPYLLLAGGKLRLKEDYLEGRYLTRFLARWQTSFATTRGADSDHAVRAAIGMRFTLFDHGDPRMDRVLHDCLVTRAAAVLPASTGDAVAPPPEGETEAALEERLDIANEVREELIRTSTKPCREAAAKRRWNRSAWVAGFAPTWTSPDGTSAALDYSGTALWTSIGYGFEGVPVLEDRAMIAAYLKTRDQEIAKDRFHDGETIEQDTLAIGGRFLFGSSSTQVNLEAVYLRNDRVDDLEDRYWRVGFGLERRLIDNIWLDVSAGRELARGEGDSVFVLGSFKWGLGAR